MSERCGVKTVSFACSFTMVLLGAVLVIGSGGSLSFAATADDLAPLSEQPRKPSYQEPVAPKYRPPMQEQSFTDHTPKPLPRPSGEAMHGTVGTEQTKKVVASSQRVAPVDNPSKTGPPAVVGRVLFRGAILPPTQIRVNRDVDICGTLINQQPVSIDPTTGGLRNAIVHVDVGVADVGAEAPHEGLGDVMQVRNKKCAFHPQVAPGRIGSEVEIINDDAVMHNTNITSGSQTFLNVALVVGGNPIRKQFKKSGLHLVKCNVHKFMYGYRYVFDDPFFAMTTEAGQFRISNLPPGLHKVTVWHETLGTVQKEVEVPAQGTINLDLEFK